MDKARIGILNMYSSGITSECYLGVEECNICTHTYINGEDETNISHLKCNDDFWMPLMFWILRVVLTVTTEA